MTAVVLIAGAMASSVLLAAIILDSMVSARAAEPAPKQFSLFLLFFLFFQAASFVLSAFAVELNLGSADSGISRFSLFVFFVLEDLRRGFSAVLVWYLPRFLFVSLGLVYSKAQKRLFLAFLLLIGAAKVLVINAQAVAYWTDGRVRFDRMAFAIDDIFTLPLLYALCLSLIVITANHLRRSVANIRKPYFWGPGFLISLVVFLLADLAERLFTDPFLAGVFRTPTAMISPFPFLSLSGLVIGSAVIARATASLRRAFAQMTQPAPPLPEARLAERGLTPREIEIAGLLLKGYVNKEIATRLDIGYGTVKNHAYSLYGKLGITSRFELIKLLDLTSPSEPVEPRSGRILTEP